MESKICAICDQRKTGGAVLNKKPVCYGCMTAAIISFSMGSPSMEKLEEYLDGIVQAVKSAWEQKNATKH